MSVVENGVFLLVSISFALFGKAALIWNVWILKRQCFHLISLEVLFPLHITFKIIVWVAVSKWKGFDLWWPMMVLFWWGTSYTSCRTEQIWLLLCSNNNKKEDTRNYFLFFFGRGGGVKGEVGKIVPKMLFPYSLRWERSTLCSLLRSEEN